MLTTFQNRISLESKGKLYLSPYAVFIRNQHPCHIIIKRSDMGTLIVLKYTSEEVVELLIEKLSSGIERTELEMFLKQAGATEPSKWIETCLKEGVLE